MPANCAKLIVVLSALVGTVAFAGPVDSAIVAAMKLTDAPNYSWRTQVVDDGATYEIVGATDRATDFSRVTMPLAAAAAAPRRGSRAGGATSNVADVIFKGAENYVIQTDDNWHKPDEIAAGNRSGSRRPGIYGGPPGAGGPRGRSSRGAGGGEPGTKGFSNLQNTLSRPHEEIGIIVGGVTDFKMEGDVISGSLPETTAQLLLVHAGQKDITPKKASGTVRIWVQNGVMVKYETRLDGVLLVDNSAGHREVTVHQTATTTFSGVGTTKVEVPAEAKQKLGT